MRWLTTRSPCSCGNEDGGAAIGCVPRSRGGGVFLRGASTAAAPRSAQRSTRAAYRPHPPPLQQTIKTTTQPLPRGGPAARAPRRRQRPAGRLARVGQEGRRRVRRPGPGARHQVRRPGGRGGQGVLRQGQRLRAGPDQVDQEGGALEREREERKRVGAFPLAPARRRGGRGTLVPPLATQHAQNTHTQRRHTISKTQARRQTQIRF